MKGENSGKVRSRAEILAEIARTGRRPSTTSSNTPIGRKGGKGRAKTREVKMAVFFASGMVESDCKTVVGQRFKQSGMIWSLNGSKSLLALRALYKPNRLDEFFDHLVAELPQVACAA